MPNSPSRLLAGLTLAASTLLLSACGGTGSPTPAVPESTPVPIVGHDGAGTVQVDEVTWSSEGRPAPQEGHYVSVKLTWRATEGDLSINPARMSFRDAEGSPRDFVYYGPDVDPVLEATDLAAGSEHSGWASFDAPGGDGDLIILTEANEEAARLPIPGP